MYLVNPLDFESSTQKSLLCVRCPRITTKLISFNTIRCIHCSHYVIKQIQKRMHWLRLWMWLWLTLQLDTINYTSVKMAIQFELIYTRIYSIKRARHTNRLFHNKWHKADGWRPEKEEKQQEEETYTGREAREREKQHSSGFSINLLICKSKTRSTNKPFRMCVQRWTLRIFRCVVCVFICGFGLIVCATRPKEWGLKSRTAHAPKNIVLQATKLKENLQ